MRPNTTIAREIQDKYHIKTRIAGDVVKVGRIGTAIRDGFFAAMDLER
jgi:hypothetical protein